MNSFPLIVHFTSMFILVQALLLLRELCVSGLDKRLCRGPAPTRRGRGTCSCRSTGGCTWSGTARSGGWGSWSRSIRQRSLDLVQCFAFLDHRGNLVAPGRCCIKLSLKIGFHEQVAVTGNVSIGVECDQPLHCREPAVRSPVLLEMDVG